MQWGRNDDCSMVQTSDVNLIDTCRVKQRENKWEWMQNDRRIFWLLIFSRSLDFFQLFISLDWAKVIAVEALVIICIMICVVSTRNLVRKTALIATIQVEVNFSLHSNWNSFRFALRFQVQSNSRERPLLGSELVHSYAGGVSLLNKYLLYAWKAQQSRWEHQHVDGCLDSKFIYHFKEVVRLSPPGTAVQRRAVVSDSFIDFSTKFFLLNFFDTWFWHVLMISFEKSSLSSMRICTWWLK